MPWNANAYPSSWNDLPTPVREKAIEIGNALLDRGMAKSQAIPIALSQARKALGSSGPADVWVIPHDTGWAVKAEGSSDVRARFETQCEAIDAAVDHARDAGVVVTVQSSDGTIRERQSFKSRL
ncbi:MAG: DUF2188 domain-containing protein [Deltaproteobacteria bacterium]|nr:MAG: DUF2188 domain-containing protein [Deltaproteobacteria bacterium]